jgi:alpha-tubulin suppressor-like RCC1 family protein
MAIKLRPIAPQPADDDDGYKKITPIAAGNAHSLVFDSDGKVYGAGYNDYGQLGVGNSGFGARSKVFTEVSLLNGKKIISVAAAGKYSIVLTGDGKVYATGDNGDGQLGLGDTEERGVFTEVSSLSGKKIIAIAAGWDHSFAVDSGGKVYATGDNEYGWLGLGDTEKREVFTEISSLKGKKIIAIAAGDDHSLALDKDGKVYAAGNSKFGQIGTYNDGKRDRFTYISLLYNKNITAIAAGDINSFVLDSDGKLYATGWNGYGQLGFSNRGRITEHIGFTEVEF